MACLSSLALPIRCWLPGPGTGVLWPHSVMCRKDCRFQAVTVIRRCVFNECRQTGWYDGVGSRHPKEYMFRRTWTHRKPAGVVESSCVNTNVVRKALETEPEPCAAVGAEMDAYDLSRSLRSLFEGFRCPGKQDEVILAENRFNHIGRTGRLLTESAMADSHPAGHRRGCIANAPTKTPALISAHRVPRSRMAHDR